MERILSKRGKKVVRWGPGLAVLITKEAREIGWDDKTFVRIMVVESRGEKKIVLERMGDV